VAVRESGLNNPAKYSKDHYPNRFAVFATLILMSKAQPGWSREGVANWKPILKNGAKGLKV